MSEEKISCSQVASPPSEIPVIDLFAGPGGLCEGFSSLFDKTGVRRFAVKVSIEKDYVAHRTLMLRAIFRKFPKDKVPECYYEYVRGNISREQFLAHPEIKDAAEHAANEAKCAELGITRNEDVDSWIREALGDEKNWVLIGGPPCQAYSLAGRARLRGKDPEKFESDARHFLYIEYLRIIQKFSPPIFVMENVKGMLNSTNGGQHIFKRILADLTDPRDDLHYEIRSLVVNKKHLDPSDYVVKADDYGVPQSRHRVILLGIRSDIAKAMTGLNQDPKNFFLKKQLPKITVNQALAGLPSLRSKLSKEPDSQDTWKKVLSEAHLSLKGWCVPMRSEIKNLMNTFTKNAGNDFSLGGGFIPGSISSGDIMPKDLKSWYLDHRLGGVLQHESRSHMRSDLHRYFFAACFAVSQNYPPTLRNFPPNLLPNHVNLNAKNIPFADRFRVQMGGAPSSTVVAHIKKDGHYYIHPDPAQCRSLTVREAARLQTFPDNYFFEGNRTEQYDQIGNAVPPLLAMKIANIIFKIISSTRK